MDEFGLVWLSSVWFDEVDFLKCSCSASQLSFTNLFSKQTNIDHIGLRSGGMKLGVLFVGGFSGVKFEMYHFHSLLPFLNSYLHSRVCRSRENMQYRV